MEIYSLNARDKRLLALCVALVAFWLIFIIGAVICAIYAVQLARYNAQNFVAAVLVFAAAVIVIALVIGLAAYLYFYFFVYKKMSYKTTFNGTLFTVEKTDARGESVVYTFLKSDIISRAKFSPTVLAGKRDVTFKVRKFTADGEPIFCAANICAVQICSRQTQRQLLKLIYPA